MYLLNRLRIYVGCSQNHPYCGEWLPNQVFRGGACGLYVVRGTQTVYSNVKLTAERDADTGGLVWKTESPTPLAGGLLDEHYYFYYPYQARASILGQGGCSLHHYGERVNRARLVGAERNIHHLRQ